MIGLAILALGYAVVNRADDPDDRLFALIAAGLLACWALVVEMAL